VFAELGEHLGDGLVVIDVQCRDRDPDIRILLRKIGFELIEPIDATGTQRKIATPSGERTRHPGAEAGTRTGDEDRLPSHPGSISTTDAGYLSSRDIRLSASTLPPVWHVGQY